MAERMKHSIFYPSIVRAFHTYYRQGFEALVTPEVLARHNKFESQPNPIIDYQIGQFYAEASRRRDNLSASHNRKLLKYLV
jgi:outer membrane scaffolding protein for murein synthesis (MipA/OmpV family)